MIALSCGIKISAVHHLDLSESTRVSDRQTDEQTDRQNYDCQDRPQGICSHGKNEDEIDQSHKSQLKFECNVYLLNYAI